MVFISLAFCHDFSIIQSIIFRLFIESIWIEKFFIFPKRFFILDIGLIHYFHFFRIENRSMWHKII